MEHNEHFLRRHITLHYLNPLVEFSDTLFPKIRENTKEKRLRNNGKQTGGIQNLPI